MQQNSHFRPPPPLRKYTLSSPNEPVLPSLLEPMFVVQTEYSQKNVNRVRRGRLIHDPPFLA